MVNPMTPMIPDARPSMNAQVAKEKPSAPSDPAPPPMTPVQARDTGTLKTETEWAQREIADLLEFVREQVELWDGAGDCGFPLYEHGKRILARHAAKWKEAR